MKLPGRQVYKQPHVFEFPLRSSFDLCA
jgi:hypothetical protein